MKIKQISLFLENKPGHLSSVCSRLGEAGINIITLSLADTQQFGILRLIVREWEKARELLKEAGCVVNTTDVVATEIDDTPGGLARILKILEEASINVEYMYAFASRIHDKAILVFRFDDPDAAIKALLASGIGIMDNVDVMK